MLPLNCQLSIEKEGIFSTDKPLQPFTKRSDRMFKTKFNDK